MPAGSAKGNAMAVRAFAKIGFLVTVLLATDFSALASDVPVRHRIGRILRSLTPEFAPMPLHFGFADAFDYYGSNRRIVPKGPVTQGEIVKSLKKRGFRDIEVLRHRGQTFVVEATGSLGERVRLVINGRTGSIDGARVIGFGGRR
jgi:hypothetical protein